MVVRAISPTNHHSSFVVGLCCFANSRVSSTMATFISIGNSNLLRSESFKLLNRGPVPLSKSVAGSNSPGPAAVAVAAAAGSGPIRTCDAQWAAGWGNGELRRRRRVAAVLFFQLFAQLAPTTARGGHGSELR